MNPPLIARWTPNGWEQWFQPTEDAYKAVEFIAAACGGEPARPHRAERVWVESVDNAVYLEWLSKHPDAKGVEPHHIFLNAREASRHLGYSPNYVACALSGAKRGEFIHLGCGVSLAYEKNVPS